MWKIFLLTCFLPFGQTSQYIIADKSKAILDLAAAWNAACIRVWLSENSINSERSHVTSLVKDLMGGVEDNGKLKFLGVAVLTFKEYLRVCSCSLTPSTCYKPLEIIVASDAVKKEFSLVSKNHTSILAKSRWLVILRQNEREEDFFDDIEIPFNVQLVSATMSSDVLRLREVYRVVSSHPLNIYDLGTWSNISGLNVPIRSIYYWRSDLEGITLRTGSIDHWPVSSVLEIEEGRPDIKIDGFFPRVWHHLEEIMNFTSMSYRSVDNSTGIKDDNGEWSGLMGMLLRNEIDAIVSELNMNEERKDVLEFTHPLLKTRYQVYFKLDGYNVSWTAMFNPFNTLIWLALAAWVCIGACALTICFKLSTTFEPECDMTRQPYTVFFFMLQSMSQQGYYKVPQSYSVRLVFLLSYLLSAIIIPSYSASLVSSLTAQIPNRPFDSLSGMLQYGNYKLIVGKNTAEYSYFANADDELYRKVANELLLSIEESDVDSNSTGGMHMLCTGSQRYAYFGVESIHDIKADLSYSSTCQIIKFSQPLSIVYQSIGMSKNSPFIGLVDYHLQNMFSSGLITRIQRSVWPILTKKHEPDFKQVQPSEVFQVFVCLVIAMIFSLFLLIVEILIFRHSKRKQSDTSMEGFTEKYNSIEPHTILF